MYLVLCVEGSLWPKVYINAHKHTHAHQRSPAFTLSSPFDALWAPPCLFANTERVFVLSSNSLNIPDSTQKHNAPRTCLGLLLLHRLSRASCVLCGSRGDCRVWIPGPGSRVSHSDPCLFACWMMASLSRCLVATREHCHLVNSTPAMEERSSRHL